MELKTGQEISPSSIAPEQLACRRWGMAESPRILVRNLMIQKMCAPCQKKEVLQAGVDSERLLLGESIRPPNREAPGETCVGKGKSQDEQPGFWNKGNIWRATVAVLLQHRTRS